jgi:hypothetical protein
MAELSIYDGQTLLGVVHGAGSEWLAFDALGNPLPGVFESKKAAVAAVNSSLSVPCVSDASARRDNS